MTNNWNQTWKAKPIPHQFRTFPEPKNYQVQKGDATGTIPVYPDDERDFLRFCHEYGWQAIEGGEK